MPLNRLTLKQMLSQNQKIGVFAPSSYVEVKDIDVAKKFMEAQGFTVSVHPQTFERQKQSAGTHQQKIDALHDLYRDENVDVIWAAGGGNRALHILDDLDFDLIRANPKPMIGFSDVTALLNGTTVKTGVVNIHGPVFKHMNTAQTLKQLQSTMPLEKVSILRQGSAEGPLFGGNLSLFQYLPETLGRDFTNGAILFLEDCNEELSRIDRMLLHLKRLGAFDKAAGLVFGQFTDLQDSARPFGYTLEDIIREHTNGLNIPIIMNAPFGHGDDNYPFCIGQKTVLNADNKLHFSIAS